MSELTSVHKAIAAVQAEIGGVAKGRRSKGGASFSYRGIDDIVEAIHPLFAKHGLVLVPDVKDIEYLGVERNMHMVKVIGGFTLIGPDGDSIRRRFTMMSQNNGGPDKASGSAISYATRYFLTNLLTIPVHGDDADPEARDDNPPKKQARKKAAPKPDKPDVEPATAKPVSLTELEAAIKSAGSNDEAVLARANAMRPRRKTKFNGLKVLVVDDKPLARELLNLLRAGKIDDPTVEPFDSNDPTQQLVDDLGAAARKFAMAAARSDYTPKVLLAEIAAEEKVEIEGDISWLCEHHPDLATKKINSLIEAADLLSEGTELKID